MIAYNNNNEWVIFCSFVILSFPLAALDYPKCCGSDSVLKIINSTNFNCDKFEGFFNRIEILTNRTNLIGSINRNLSDNYCVDIEESVNLYKLIGLNDGIVKEKEADFKKFYPKCCPLNYLYNTISHSCEIYANQTNINDLKRNFLKIGLLNCKIILDIKVNSRNDFKIQEDNSIYFLDSHKTYNYNNYCIDNDENQRIVVRVCENSYDICHKFKCIHKCCPDGQSFINGSFCKNTFIHGLNLNFTKRINNSQDPFAIIHGYRPPLYVLSESTFEFYINKNGTFVIYETLERNSTSYYGINDNTYCIEYVQKAQLNQFLFFRSFPEQNLPIKFVISRWAMSISCIFLVITIVYYIFTKESRNLFGKTLVSFCISMLFAFLFLSYAGFDMKSSTKACQIIGFIIYYISLTSFFWMNIMCFDIYWTFGTPKSFTCDQHRNKEWKQFLWYSLYGWGFPLILTVTVLILYHIDILPTTLQIIVGIRKCFIQKGNGNYGFLFFTIPVALLNLCNIILFIKTIIYCMKVKSEISKMNDTQVLKGQKKNNFNKYKDRLSLLLKLFIVMGISFLFEVVSSFYDFKQNPTTSFIELIWDNFNSLQGFLIFLLFICKKRVFDKCKKKLGFTKIRKVSLNSAATTQSNLSVPTNKVLVRKST